MNRTRRLSPLCLLCATSWACAATTHGVEVLESGFQPGQLQIATGDTVLWTNRSGHHHIRSDDGSFYNDIGPGHSTGAWTLKHVFNAPGTYGYRCTIHNARGEVTVTGEPTPTFQIDEGIAGSWYDPTTVGQGLLFEASETAGVLALAWFTWDGEGGYDWMIGNGPYSGDTATLTLYRASGGRFNDPTPVQTEAFGSALLRFQDCSNASFLFELTGPQLSGEIQLTRVLPPQQRCLERNGDSAQ